MHLESGLSFRLTETPPPWPVWTVMSDSSTLVLSVSTLAGLLCPPPWSHVSLVLGLVSHLVLLSVGESRSGCCQIIFPTAGCWSNFEVVSTPGQTPRSGSAPQYAFATLVTLGQGKTKNKEGTASCFWWSHLKNPFLEALCLLLGQEACQNHWIVRAAGDAPHHTL